MALMSDAYEVTADFRVVLKPERDGATAVTRTCVAPRRMRPQRPPQGRACGLPSMAPQSAAPAAWQRRWAHHLTATSASLRGLPLRPVPTGVPPTVKLDGAYKFVDDMQRLIPNRSPSLLRCTKLTIEGDKIEIESGVVFVGKVVIKNASGAKRKLKRGTYEDTTVEL